MIVVFCGVCGKDKGQKKKQGRAVKSCTTLSCLENGVQKYRGGVDCDLIFFRFWKKQDRGPVSRVWKCVKK